MPRKHFRKFLPDHAALRDHRHLRWAGRWLQQPNLWHLNRASVSGGVAVGMLCALIPGPVQMPAAAICALLFHVNLPVAVATTLLSNPLTWPFIIIAALTIGNFILGNGGHAPTDLHWDINWDSDISTLLMEFWDWLMSLGLAFLVGEIILGIALAILGYAAVQLGWRLYLLAYLRRRARRRLRSQ